MKRSQYTNSTKKDRVFKTENLKTFVALGLSAILPSLAFSAESDESIASLLAQAPSLPSNSKVKVLANYSPVADLRTSTTTPRETTNWLDSSQTWNQNTTLNFRVNVDGPTIVHNNDYVVSNDATVTINLSGASQTDSGFLFGLVMVNHEEEFGHLSFTGNGTFIINVDETGDHCSDRDGVFSYVDRGTNVKDNTPFKITSKFIFRASGDVRSFITTNTGKYGGGKTVINSPYLEIDMDNGGKNKNTQKYIFYTRVDHENRGDIYFNANTDNPLVASNETNIMKLTGNFYTANANFYAHFSNQESFLKGNLDLDGEQKAVVTFSKGASMTGDIDARGNGEHSVSFDNASFVGSVKNSKNNTNGINTTVAFKNTAGKTFGNGTDDIVASSYKGSFVGTFDVSTSSTTVIKGGTSGEKGFVGSGTNFLTFDFKGDASSGVSANSSFTIGGGNAQSLYVMSGMTEKGKVLDLSQLSDANTLYSKIKSAGIIIKEGALIQNGNNTNNVLQGTLFFQKTNIQVGTNGNALFATKENIVGSNNDLNRLALGAMFGNATWNDENKDGAITANEIISNNGVNYKLSNGQSGSQTTTDDKTSTGNVGQNGDGIKKNITFIFDNTNGYIFNGDKQGYSGIIAGGTNDSKYYFANAGYINRTQIEDAKGDLILFNTAFRGDLGVANKDVSILLDFSGERNGLRAENGTDSFANIVGSGSKNVVFNFTGNTKKEKYGGAVVGATSSSAKYTMLNLRGSGTNGELQASGTNRTGASKTLIDAIQGAGVTGFNKTDANGVNTAYASQNTTDIGEFDKNKTTLALVGTSLDATNLNFQDYIYDFTFGSGITDYQGILVQDSRLKGVIDLTAASATNNNAGHSFVFKGTAIEGNASGVKAEAGKLKGFSYDDKKANYSNAVKFELSGLNQANYVSNSDTTKVKGDSLIFTQTNLEGDLWADNSVAVNLDFTNDRTWKMDESGFDLGSGSSVVINGNIAKLTQTNSNAPILQIQNTGKLGIIELINTGADARFKITSGWSNAYAQSFNLRGTSFAKNGSSAADKRISGVVDNGYFNMVFAKGTNLKTTILKQSGDSDYANITDKEADTGYWNGTQLNHTGSFSGGSYDGNYIAESSGAISGFNSSSGFNLAFIGENAWDFSSIAGDNFFAQNSTFTLINASNSTAFSATKIGDFFKRSNNDISVTATITIEGTSITDGANIVGRTNPGQQALLTYNITFIKGDSGTYVSDITGKYTDLITTTANGVLSDQVLKVAQSSLGSGINFQNSNFNVLFVGNASQTLGTNNNVFQGGSATSTLTFRDSNLNAGSGTSSIQNIKGTIAFDLTHKNEDIQISGTLKNMLAEGGKHQVQFKGRGSSADPVKVNHLVFVDMSDFSSGTFATSLGKFDDSLTAGLYFNDKDVFGEALSQADYSDLALLAEVDDSKSSSLIFADNATVALEKGEVWFVGTNSHKFDDTTDANKLGDSTGGTLTFVDAGELRIANLVNKNTSGVQQGKGTINLIGNTSIELKNGSGKTLTLFETNSAGQSQDITGEGITINAIFTGSNPLGDVGQKISGGVNDKTGASTANIGSAGEKTIYHILFDYSSSGLTFGAHQAYTGTITGLTSDSTIKFKNAGYINSAQIDNTDAIILVDNTQIKGNFRGDFAVLDFRNGQPAISDNILTSKADNSQLSQKILTFDLSGGKKLSDFEGSIQAGYKVAPQYTDKAQSVLTFQNAVDMTLGDDIARNTGEVKTANSSAFIRSLANDVGFSDIGNAETEEPSSAVSENTSYILKGTKLVFQGTNITASTNDKSISENLYSLDLSFDASDTRGSTGLGETLQKSVLTANSITIGELTGTNSHSLGLSLSFKNKGSLVGETKGNFNNVLSIKLKDNAVFNLNATSDNGNIGTLVLGKNETVRGRNAGATPTNTLALSAKSSMNISAGSMSFVGVFDTSRDTVTAQADNYGAVNVAFDGTNKAYGVIKHKGDTSVTLSGNALLTSDEASALGFTKDADQFADLVIDASVITSGKTLSLNLAHTSGLVGVIGTSIQSNGSQTYTSLNLSNAKGNIALKGAFDFKGSNATFTANNSVSLVENVVAKLADNQNGSNVIQTTLNFQDGTLKSGDDSTKTFTLYAFGKKTSSNLTFINTDSKVTIKLASLQATPSNRWGVGGTWNFRGTNLDFSQAFLQEHNTDKKTFVFAKGSGTETTETQENGSNLKLSELTTSDKINESTLSGNLEVAQTTVKTLGLRNASFTFIGKEAMGIAPDKQKIDGIVNNSISFAFYNGLIKSGSVLLDNVDSYKSTANTDVTTLRGTDTFNLSSVNTNGATGANNSTINAVYVNGSNLTTTTRTANAVITGNTYIDASTGANDALKTTLAQYETSNAGGALTQTQLKTLQSKAYGNITLDSGVTANMKFIGDNSHSFDRKTIVKGSGTNAEFYTYTGDGDQTQTNASEWGKISISDADGSKGMISLETNSNPSDVTSAYSYATLKGGNDNSRFDFDHTNVSLELIKDAGGRTYVYNSDVIGAINVTPTTPPTYPTVPAGDPKPNTLTPSTTLFFNAKMQEKPTSGTIDSNTQELTATAKSFINSQFKDGLGINLDLSTAHALVDNNLTGTNGSKKLGATNKQTNIVLIGKGSVIANNANSTTAIDLKWLPETQNSERYAYTIISGGIIDSMEIAKADSNYEINATVFGNSKVQLVDTYVVGVRNFAQVGFINTNQPYNQSSSWGGADTVEQYLIFDMGGDKANQLNKGGSADVITNESPTSRYIFSNLNTEDPIEFKTTIKQTLNDAMSNIAPSNKQVIGTDVKGYLGLRGVSIKGDIDDGGNNGIDIVFNSTSDSNASQGIAYEEWFDADGKHQSRIVKGKKNLVSYGTDYATDPNISGYAVLMSNDTSGDGVATIKGTANKDITFIGDKSVKGGFDKLKIEGGSKDSNYTFYEVGELSQTFLKNVGLYKDTSPSAPQPVDMKATLGNFTFENSTIIGDINVDQNNNGNNNVLTFKNIAYSGTISGTLKKNLAFGIGSNDIKIIGGSDDSNYDFSNLTGKSINLNINMSNGSNKYFASSITGFENGDISLVGSLNLAKTSKETNASSDYSNSFAFNNNAKWTVTDNSRVMNLSLSNTGTSFNLDLASAPRSSSASTQDAAQNNNDLRVLEVGNLSSDGGQVLLGTMIDSNNQSNSKSDKIKASVIGNGTLYITAKDTSITSGNVKDQNIVLVEADTAYGEVVGAERKEGLSYVTTNLVHQTSGDSGTSWNDVQDESTVNSSDSHRWVLSSFDTKTNQELVDESGFIVSNPYRMLMIETNNLNKRMGDLRDNDYNQGAWIRVFNGSDSGDGAKNLYTNIQLGYDYGTPAIGAKNYSGVAFSTSIVDIDGNQYSGKANTYSLGVYNAYIADSGLYVDTIAKYLYTDQKITPSGSSDSSFGSHALSLGVEVGYRAYMGESNFYFETQAEAIGGVIFGVKDIAMGVIGGRDINGELKTTTTLNTRVGLVQGYSLKTQSGFRADFRLGASLVNEFVSEANPVVLYDGITEASTSIGNDVKVVVNVGTNLILTDQWRVYIDAERSFGGSRNVDYQANIGARFSFGDKISSLPKPEKPLPLKVKEESKK